MRRMFLIALLPLAACATPQQQCISGATKDVRVLDRLIATSQANVSRGYAIDVQQHLIITSEVCGEAEGEKIYCDVPSTEETNVPVAIDLNVEQAKLNSLVTKRAQLATQAGEVIASCKVTYPEG
jgi:hypothetical protein